MILQRSVFVDNAERDATQRRRGRFMPRARRYTQRGTREEAHCVVDDLRSQEGALHEDPIQQPIRWRHLRSQEGALQ